MDWFFDGIGTEVLSIIVSLIIGGAIGYQIGVRKTSKQAQKAGNESKQSQKVIIKDDYIIEGKKRINYETTVAQSQIAGDNSSQTQIGEFRNDE